MEQSKYNVIPVPGMTHDYSGQNWYNPCPSCQKVLKKTQDLYMITYFDPKEVHRYEWVCSKECANLFILGNL